MRILSLAVAVALTAATVGRADEPPRPPEGARFDLVPAGGTWKAPACAEENCGLCLDKPAWDYAANRITYYEIRIQKAEARAESSPWLAASAGLALGLAVGAAVALVKR